MRPFIEGQEDIDIRPCEVENDFPIELICKALKALQNVERGYYSYVPPVMPVSDEVSAELPEKKYAKYSERIFAYELYHQLRREFGGSLYVTGECGKNLTEINSPKCPLFTKDKRWYQPDIVLHKGMDNFDMQGLAIEIKIGNNLQGLKTDIDKIIDYMHCIDFKAGMIMAYGSDEKKFIKKIKRWINNWIKESSGWENQDINRVMGLFKRIVCVYVFVDINSATPEINYDIMHNIYARTMK